MRRGNCHNEAGELPPQQLQRGHQSAVIQGVGCPTPATGNVFHPRLGLWVSVLQASGFSRNAVSPWRYLLLLLPRHLSTVLGWLPLPPFALLFGETRGETGQVCPLRLVTSQALRDMSVSSRSLLLDMCYGSLWSPKLITILMGVHQVQN